MTTNATADGAVVYPGTFDPVTFGHLDIIARARRLFPQLVVAVSEGAAGGKKPVFDLDERIRLLRDVLAEQNDAPGPVPEVTPLQGLLVDFCRARGIRMALRGMRAVSDFEYEFQMAWANARLNREVETIFLVASDQGHFISSRLAREVAQLGGALDSFVPPQVARALQARFGAPRKRSGNGPNP